MCWQLPRIIVTVEEPLMVSWSWLLRSHLHKYLETVRKTRKCPSCQQLSSRKSESDTTSDTIHNPRTSRYSKFTTPLLWAEGECQHPSLNET